MQTRLLFGAAARLRAARMAFAASATLLAVGFAGTAQASDPALARNLAATCANCHGTDGRATGDMKSLAGLPAPALIAMMNEFKAGNLPATIMHQISKGYTDEQIRLIATYFAAQAPKK